MAGSLLEAADRLLKKGLHPTAISEAFQKAAEKSVEILTKMAVPVDLSDREKLLQVLFHFYRSRLTVKPFNPLPLVFPRGIALFYSEN